MLKSLIGTGLQARLSPEQYELYKSEVLALEKSWKKEIRSGCKTQFKGGISDFFIPQPWCQYDFYHIIYDYRKCINLRSPKQVPLGYKTVADGGTIPCALLSILRYYKFSETLPVLGELLVTNGYRTKDNGTRWIAFDKVPEIVYGIKTEIQTSIYGFAESIVFGRPVAALVSATWLHKDFSTNLPSNECIVVWRLEGDKAVITTTSSHSTLRVDLYDLLKNIKRAWSFSK